MKQVPFWGPANIRHQCTKFSCHSNLKSGICVPLITIYLLEYFLIFSCKEIENGSIPWIAFLSVVQNDGPRFHLLQQCRIRKPLPQPQSMPTTLKDWLFSLFFLLIYFILLLLFFFFSTLRLWGIHLAHSLQYASSQLMWLTLCWMLESLYTGCWLWCVDLCK